MTQPSKAARNQATIIALFVIIAASVGVMTVCERNLRVDYSGGWSRVGSVHIVPDDLSKG